jgi:hypothetical protein
LFLVASFTSWNEEVNTIRNGMAVAFFLNYCYHFYKEEKKPMLIYGFLSIFSHFSTAIFIGISLLTKFAPKIKLKWYVVAFFVTMVLSYIGVSVLNLGIQNIEMDQVHEYTNNIEDSSYQTGFRVTFALYNTFFLLLFLYFRKVSQTRAIIRESLLKLYIGSSCIFFLWFAIPFSDRVGAYSWQLIPLLLCLNIQSSSRRHNLLLTFAFLAFALINYNI